MPRGKFMNHKGRNRRFTNPEELEEERRRDEEKRKWRQQQGDATSSDEERAVTEEESGDSDEETSSDEEEGKAKGVSNLIEIENPNRVQKKAKKAAALTTEDVAAKPQLTRREREEVEKVRAQAAYQKLHAEGKTDQARADLARLAIIRQQREDARKARETEQKDKETAAKLKTAQTQKALGKK